MALLLTCNERFGEDVEGFIWVAVTLGLVVMTALSPMTPMMALCAWAMLAFVGYDYYESNADEKASMNANRFFGLMAIGFMMALAWLDFATALTLLVLVNAVMWGAYRIRMKKGLSDSNHANEVAVVEKANIPGWAQVAQDYAPLLLLVWVVRSFVLQPYHVPTGSLEPSLLPHELILVKQYQYGLRFPMWPLYYGKVVPVSLPKRGDIALFRYPENEHILLIKRVIGLPGDHITYKNKVLRVNGKVAKQLPIHPELSKQIDRVPHLYPQDMYSEQLPGYGRHLIYRSPEQANRAKQTEWTVPKGMYFMMGDNRDNSYDSRFWGFVEQEKLIGKAWLVFMSWDQHHRIRWKRLGTRL